MYYIYGHFLDGKCIYIGSNCKNMNNSRAYDLSDRNKEYAKLTKNRKDKIEVRILKELPNIKYTNNTNGKVLSEEMKMIAKYHDKGEALCSNQDYRGIRNPMYGKHHSEESIEKNRQSNLNYLKTNGTNGTWFNSLSEEEKINFKILSGNAARGKIWIYKDKVRKYILPEELDLYLKQGWTKGRPSEIISKGNAARGKIWIYKDKIRKYILPEELDKYIKDGWTKGRPSEIISKGNKNRDLSKSKFIKRTKCLLQHNNIIKEFNLVSDLYKYCKIEYNLSSGTIKKLLRTEQEFIPFYDRLQKAKGLKLKRLK